jgi:hypothetical protein
MATSIPLAYLAFRFAFGSREEIHQNYAWHCYLFLLALFISMTNQVTCQLFFMFQISNHQSVNQGSNDSCRSTDPQMVAYVFRSASDRSVDAGLPHHFTAKASPHPPRLPARDLFLHHHWLAKLAPGENSLLEGTRVRYRTDDGLPSPRRRLQMGSQTGLIDWIFVVPLLPLSSALVWPLRSFPEPPATNMVEDVKSHRRVSAYCRSLGSDCFDWTGPFPQRCFVNCPVSFQT